MWPTPVSPLLLFMDAESSNTLFQMSCHYECISFHCNSTNHNEYILYPCRCHWCFQCSILIYVGKWILKVLPRLPLLQRKWGMPCVCAYVFVFMQQIECFGQNELWAWNECLSTLSQKGTLEVICYAFQQTLCKQVSLWMSAWVYLMGTNHSQMSLWGKEEKYWLRDPSFGVPQGLLAIMCIASKGCRYACCQQSPHLSATHWHSLQCREWIVRQRPIGEQSVFGLGLVMWTDVYGESQSKR